MEKVYILDRESNITYYLVGVKSISPQLEATLTQYPIPEGSFISDYSYKNSDSLSFQVISDGYNNVKKSYYVDADGNSRVLTYEIFRDVIRKWQDDAVRLDIQSVHKLFNSMVLTSISWNEGSGNWSSFKPTLTFTEARIGQLYTVPLSALNVVYGADYAQKETPSGTDNGTEVTASSVIGTIAGDAAVAGGIGAIIGTVVGGPGVGTAVGAAVGGVVGGVVGFFRSIF